MQNTENSNTIKRIYITHPIPTLALEMLDSRGYEITVGTNTGIISQKDINKILMQAEKKGKGYHALITLLTDKIDSTTIDAGPSLKIVSNYAIGYDNIDIEALQKREVTATNTPGNYINTIAEHVLALILSATTRTAEADRYVRKGLYKGWDPMLFTGTDIEGKTIGLIGAGHIGERVAHHLSKSFGVKIVYFDTRKNSTIEEQYSAEKIESLDKLLEISDIVSLHVPLLPSTKHMVNKDFLNKMKKTAYLINTSRGAVIDEAELVIALKNKVIAGAALDVYEFEPKLAKGLTKLENVVLTPHIASASEYARNEMARIAAQNIIDVFEDKKPAGLISL